jgi:butirosin biosynthesis protein H-like/uncharacterized protein DUF4872
MPAAGLRRRPPAFPHRQGRDCAVASLRNLLHAEGVPLSEGMVFGLGEGLSFWYAEFPSGPFPVLIGQNLALEEDLCGRLGIGLRIHEPATPSDADRAMEQVRCGIPTIVKADPYYLDYCWEGEPPEARGHFGEHVLLVVAIEGRADAVAWVSDIWHDTLVPVPLEQLHAARSATEGEPYLLPRDRWYEIVLPAEVRWRDQVRPAAQATARRMLQARGSFGVSGIRTASQRLPAWAERTPAEELPDALSVLLLRLDGGAAGSCFRAFFSEFLTEAGELLGDALLGSVGRAYGERVVPVWRGLLEALGAAVRSPDDATRLVAEAGRLLGEAAELEARLCGELAAQR